MIVLKLAFPKSGKGARHDVQVNPIHIMAIEPNGGYADVRMVDGSIYNTMDTVREVLEKMPAAPTHGERADNG